MRSRPAKDWRPETVTARDLVADSSVFVRMACRGCRALIEFNVWKIGARMADTPLQRLRFRCTRCGVYPREIVIARRTSANADDIMTVSLECRWDERVREQQQRALARAEMAWRARGGR